MAKWKKRSIGPNGVFLGQCFAAYLGLIGFISLIGGAESADKTWPFDHELDAYINQTGQVTVEANKCFYKSDTEQVEVSFEEWNGYRVTNTFLWFFGLSQEKTIHELGTMPVFVPVRCDIVKDDVGYDLNEYAAEITRLTEEFENNDKVKLARENVEWEGDLKAAVTDIPSPK